MIVYGAPSNGQPAKKKADFRTGHKHTFRNTRKAKCESCCVLVVSRGVDGGRKVGPLSERGCQRQGRKVVERSTGMAREVALGRGERTNE